ncbi:unnamed protein product [Protopolystoma xenopodis]|uniref:Uncharacterized protein n=1 Tax=Protopolystoma xenopodis TaxID=117903 RepID=A0A448WGU7_9PLAT|nr:unnamed protein product [Protopolystoma xenopodis]
MCNFFLFPGRASIATGVSSQTATFHMALWTNLDRLVSAIERLVLRGRMLTDSLVRPLDCLIPTGLGSLAASSVSRVSGSRNAGGGGGGLIGRPPGCLGGLGGPSDLVAQLLQQRRVSRARCNAEEILKWDPDAELWVRLVLGAAAGRLKPDKPLADQLIDSECRGGEAAYRSLANWLLDYLAIVCPDLPNDDQADDSRDPSNSASLNHEHLSSDSSTCESSINRFENWRQQRDVILCLLADALTSDRMQACADWDAQIEQWEREEGLLACKSLSSGLTRVNFATLY